MRKIIIMFSVLILSSCSLYQERVNLFKDRSDCLYAFITINDKFVEPFLLDTGASETSITKSLYDELVCNDTINTYIDLEEKQFITAGGDLITCKRVLISKMTIGKKEFKNVEVSIINSDDTPFLLGSNILKQFSVFRLDYDKNQLIYNK